MESKSLLVGRDKVLEILEHFTKREVINESSIKMYLVEKLNNKHYYLHKPSMNKKKVGEEVSKMLLISLKNMLKDKSIVKLNPIVSIEDTLSSLKVNEVNGINTFLEDIKDCDNINTNMKEMSITDLCFYMIEIGNDINNIKFFRRYTNAKTLKKRAKPYSIINNSLSECKDEMFFIDNIIDFAMINNEDLLILNRYSFEIITNYKDDYIENLKKALKIIEESSLIENFDTFKEDCMESILIAKKFTNIMKKDNLSKIKNNLSKVPGAIAKAEIPIEFKNNKLVYRDKSEIYYIIEILSDSFAMTLIGGEITNSL